MGKLIVFEGISGSGKSYLINLVKQAVQDIEETKWFDNKYVGEILDGVDKKIEMTRDTFSLCYALDFLGKYTYFIEPLIEKKSILMHRYIYTALAHDYVRGTGKDILSSWYNTKKIRIPDNYK
jgi:thymidylate kinase